MNLIFKTNNKLKGKYTKYNNFITNYFIENKLTYFKDNSLNYSAIPEDCKTNNYLENYNGFIKSQLGNLESLIGLILIFLLKKKVKGR